MIVMGMMIGGNVAHDVVSYYVFNTIEWESSTSYRRTIRPWCCHQHCPDNLKHSKHCNISSLNHSNYTSTSFLLFSSSTSSILSLDPPFLSLLFFHVFNFPLSSLFLSLLYSTNFSRPLFFFFLPHPFPLSFPFPSLLSSPSFIPFLHLLHHVSLHLPSLQFSLSFSYLHIFPSLFPLFLFPTLFLIPFLHLLHSTSHLHLLPRWICSGRVG